MGISLNTMEAKIAFTVYIYIKTQFCMMLFEWNKIKTNAVYHWTKLKFTIFWTKHLQIFCLVWVSFSPLSRYFSEIREKRGIDLVRLPCIFDFCFPGSCCCWVWHFFASTWVKSGYILYMMLYGFLPPSGGFLSEYWLHSVL